MTRRAGATLIEVLISIFIMGVGLLALLTLFPLGALSMAQAIKDDRCAQAAANAAAVAQTLGIKTDATVVQGLNNTNDVFDDPNPLGPGNKLPQLSTNALTVNGPSYPVYVDPQGVSFSSMLGLQPPFVGIPRRSVSIATSTQQVNRWFSVLDDMSFPKNIPNLGTPDVSTRDNTYTHAYLLKRRRVTMPTFMDLTIVVYRKRPLVFGLGENTFTGVLFGMPNPSPGPGLPTLVNTNSAIVSWAAGQSPPAIRKGSWVCDATMLDEGDAPTKRPATPHGFFYRVMAATPTGSNQLSLELQSDTEIPTQQGVLVVMEGVAEVFKKGTWWEP